MISKNYLTILLTLFVFFGFTGFLLSGGMGAGDMVGYPLFRPTPTGKCHCCVSVTGASGITIPPEVHSIIDNLKPGTQEYDYVVNRYWPGVKPINSENIKEYQYSGTDAECVEKMSKAYSTLGLFAVCWPGRKLFLDDRQRLMSPEERELNQSLKPIQSPVPTGTPTPQTSVPTGTPTPHK